MATPCDGHKVSALILASQDMLAKDITLRRYAAMQEMFESFGVEKEKLLEYTQYELAYLANAIAESNPSLFNEYIDWTKSMFQSKGISLDLLRKNIGLVTEGLMALLPAETHEVISRYMSGAVAEIEGPAIEAASFINFQSPHGPLARRYLDAALDGDRGGAISIVMNAFHAGLGIQDIYLHVLQQAQYEIGRLWQTNSITVAQEHFCSAVAQLIMSQLYYPHICAGEKTRGVMVGLCAGGELHEIGIRMVADLLELDGWSVCYLGANMPAYDIVDVLLQKNARILAVSAAMSSSVNKVEKIIGKVRASEAAGTKILVGGFGFNRDDGLWKLVGADAYASNGQEALRLANAFMAGG